MAVGPSMLFASWSIWAGAAATTDFQSCMSGTPLESAWVNWVMAASATSAPWPPARSMSFRPSVALVASPSETPMERDAT